MFYVSCALCFSSIFLYGSHDLQAIEVKNVCHAQFPGVTEERATRLMGLSYEAVDAANKSDLSLLRQLLFSVKREVEGMMNARIKLEQFIDDAFWQAEQKGASISGKQKKQIKRNLGIIEKSASNNEQELFDFEDEIEDIDIYNFIEYKEYADQPHYDAPASLEAGLYLIIIGGVVSFIPFPGCVGAGKWAISVGGGLIVNACVNGCDKQKIDIRQRPIGF